MTKKLYSELDQLCEKVKKHLSIIEKQKPTSIDDKDKFEERPGIYIFGTFDSPEYIGATKNIKKRIKQLTKPLENSNKNELTKKDSKHILARKLVNTVFGNTKKALEHLRSLPLIIYYTNTKEEALLLERILIYILKPKYNSTTE